MKVIAGNESKESHRPTQAWPGVLCTLWIPRFMPNYATLFCLRQAAHRALAAAEIRLRASALIRRRFFPPAARLPCRCEFPRARTDSSASIAGVR